MKNNTLCTVVCSDTSCNTPICTCLNDDQCNLKINDVCQSNPCLNNGNCVRNANIHDGSYRCECPIGYIGTRCEYCK
jgi:hypothetical protein